MGGYDVKALACVLLVCCSCAPALRTVRLCSRPQLVVVAGDTGEQVIQATKEGIEYWNDGRSASVLVYGGVVPEWTSETTPLANYITIRVLPRSHARTSTVGGTAQSIHRDGCISGTRITIYVQNLACARQLGATLRHELGHALGLSHEWIGIMTPRLPYCTKEETGKKKP